MIPPDYGSCWKGSYWTKPPFSVWCKHDENLAINWELARSLLPFVDGMKATFKRDQQNASSPEHRVVLEIKLAKLQGAADLIQRTWDLYHWARDEGKARRPESPLDTALAEESRYAVAIGLEDGKRISPMRGLSELNTKLMTMWYDMAELHKQEQAGRTFATSWLDFVVACENSLL